MDAADLRIFAAVARTGSMSKAASELGTVQSNVPRASARWRTARRGTVRAHQPRRHPDRGRICACAPTPIALPACSRREAAVADEARRPARSP